MSTEQARIEVKIAPDGTVQIVVTGIAGAACLDATDGLRRALGGVELQHGVTLDYYAQPQQSSDVDPLAAYAQQLRTSSEG